MSSTLQFQLNPKIEGIWTHACYDNPPEIDSADNVQNDFDERATNKEGYVAYGLTEPRKVYVLIRAKTHGFEEITLGPIQMPHDELITVDLVQLKGHLSRLTAHREGFQNTGGQIVRLSGVSAFMHYERFLNGEDIRPLLQQVRDLGSNTLRVFGMAHYIPVNAGRRPFRPSDYGDRYFDAQAEFLGLAEEYDQYVYWSVFPDAELIGIGDKRAFLNREVECLKASPNTVGELTNEQDAHSFNSVDPRSVDRPSGVPFTSGSYGDIGGEQPYPWDFCDYHTPRDYPKHIKDSCVVDHPNYVKGSGVMLGEPDRYGWDGNNNSDQARLSAGASRESSLGMIFHSTKGRESLLYDDQTLNIAKVFFKALL